MFDDLVTISVRATFPMFDGRVARGYVTFDPPDDLRSLLDVNGAQIIVPEQIRKRIDTTGALDIIVPASNGPNVSPCGWTWKVTEYIDGASNGPNVYYVEVPFDSPDGVMHLGHAQHVQPVSAAMADLIQPAPEGADKPVWTADTPSTTALVGHETTYQFAATGTPVPVFAIGTGAPPTGMSLDPVTGILSGTPTVTGAFTFTVTATNEMGSISTGTLTITVAESVDWARISASDGVAGASPTFGVKVGVGTPHATTPGNLLLAGVFGGAGVTAMSIPGWTTTSSFIPSIQIFYKIADGTETVVTPVAVGGAIVGVILAEYAGSANPVQVEADTPKWGGGSPTSDMGITPFTTTHANDLVFTIVTDASGLMHAHTPPFATATPIITDGDATLHIMAGEYLPGAILTAFEDHALVTVATNMSGMTAAFKGSH